MTRVVELWMPPASQERAESLLSVERTRALVRRSMAVFDALVAVSKKALSASAAMNGISPAPLATWAPPGVIGWPTTQAGYEMGSGYREVLLALYQIGELRSVVGIVVCRTEWYVVWLQMEYLKGRRDDFQDAADAALARQSLYGSLGELTKLEWLEAE